MFDSSKIVMAEEEEMEDFHDYEDEETSGTHSKLDDIEDEEDDEDEDEISVLVVETVPVMVVETSTPSETPPKKPVKNKMKPRLISHPSITKLTLIGLSTISKKPAAGCKLPASDWRLPVAFSCRLLPLLPLSSCQPE